MQVVDREDSAVEAGDRERVESTLGLGTGGGAPIFK